MVQAIKKLGVFYVTFGAGFVVGCVYVSLILMVPAFMTAAQGWGGVYTPVEESPGVVPFRKGPAEPEDYFQFKQRQRREHEEFAREVAGGRR